jgi:hypothetical protein
MSNDNDGGSGWGMGGDWGTSDWGMGDLDITASLNSAMEVDLTSSINQMVEQANKVSGREAGRKLKKKGCVACCAVSLHCVICPPPYLRYPRLVK